MNTTTPRPTPETDAEVGYFDLETAVSADFARKLERERDKARRSAEVNRLCGDAVVAMCKRQESEIAAMREAIKEAHTELSTLLDTINNSRGVDGWHLNGDIATWDEFEINPAATITKLQPFIAL